MLKITRQPDTYVTNQEGGEKDTDFVSKWKFCMQKTRIWLPSEWSRSYSIRIYERTGVMDINTSSDG